MPATSSSSAGGAEVNAQDNEGRTPLAIAEQEGHEGIVELLKQHGATDDE